MRMIIPLRLWERNKKAVGPTSYRPLRVPLAFRSALLAIRLSTLSNASALPGGSPGPLFNISSQSIPARLFARAIRWVEHPLPSSLHNSEHSSISRYQPLEHPKTTTKRKPYPRLPSATVNCLAIVISYFYAISDLNHLASK